MNQYIKLLPNILCYGLHCSSSYQHRRSARSCSFYRHDNLCFPLFFLYGLTVRKLLVLHSLKILTLTGAKKKKKQKNNNTNFDELKRCEVNRLNRTVRAEIRDDFLSCPLKYTVNRYYECILRLKSLKLGA